MKRYFCPQPETQRLNQAESHHCLHVMRQKVGDFFSVFDGKGSEWKVQLDAIEKGEVLFKKIEERKISPAPFSICLAQGITKNKSMDFIIQKATELGVSEIIPLISARSISQLGNKELEGRRQKWEQLTIEAAKQCGQNWLPQMHPLQKPDKFFANAKLMNAIKLMGSLQDEARSLKEVIRNFFSANSTAKKVIMMVGPEGDFTSEEIAAAQAAGFIPVSFGATILRAETAALYSLSVLLYEFS